MQKKHFELVLDCLFLDTFDIWLRDLKAKAEASQIHSGQKMDIELLGQFDTQPNIYNEKIISLDIDKILYYIGLGVSCQQQLLEILGILGRVVKKLAILKCIEFLAPFS